MSTALETFEVLVGATGSVGMAKEVLRRLDGIPGLPKVTTVNRDLAKLTLQDLVTKRPNASVRSLALALSVPRSTVHDWLVELEKASGKRLRPDGGTCNPVRKAREAPAVPTTQPEGRKPVKASPRRRKYQSYRGAPTTSAHIGVSKDRSGWRGYVKAGGEFVFRRFFRTEQEAARAARAARKRFIADMQKQEAA